MNLESVIVAVLQILVIQQGISVVQTSHIQNAKKRIHHEINGILSPQEIASIKGDVRRSHHRYNGNQHRNRWSGRRRTETFFTPWSTWSECDSRCKKHRERFCRVKRKCGSTKHLEEKVCWGCEHHQEKNHSPSLNITNNIHTPVVINNPPPTPSVKHLNHFHVPVFQEVKEHRVVEYDDEDTDGDFYVIKRQKPKLKKRRKPIYIDVDDYDDLDDEEDEDGYYNKKLVRPIRLKNWARRGARGSQTRSGRKSLRDSDGGEYDEEINLDEISRDANLDYEEEYDYDHESGNYTRTVPKEKAVFEAPPKHKRAYSKWSKWTKCSPKCTTRRYKKCRLRDICGKDVLREIAYCYTEKSFCEQWLQQQVKRSSFDLRPAAPLAADRRDITVNSIANDYVINGKGYRGPEYAPMKLKCGIAAIRNNKRNLYDLLKIIGGKAAKKGEWPWQVAIFNRFKEAFCGGTLIAPQWVLTAAHCVRKVLYVRIGEHNLDFEDGTELQMRVARSIKHPTYDKKTVDSDIALLKLPKPVNATTWIGFSCLPRPYQPLPKNVECTVIGWGKRRNRDQSGTSILHQAEVPIIPMDNCRSVYEDYTITKNMFCAGHKRGRIDTCAGDSGGPLLCRDSTKPNHPWTIFGITSFGDGCAKRNKFGIYAKVPNYVDWIWSVVNCNGNCKTNKRL